jgi:hypothetical protein
MDQPAVQPRTVSLDELAELLGRFEVLTDKRRGRCWSPTRYADGTTSRGNAGVHSVSCLVFDSLVGVGSTNHGTGLGSSLRGMAHSRIGAPPG